MSDICTFYLSPAEISPSVNLGVGLLRFSAYSELNAAKKAFSKILSTVAKMKMDLGECEYRFSLVAEGLPKMKFLGRRVRRIGDGQLIYYVPIVQREE